MMDTVEKARHAQERGDILRTLKEDYQSEMTSIRNLIGALDAQGIALSPDGVAFHLVYLADQGYVRIWRAGDLPHQRKDRRTARWVKPDTILFAKLLPKGLQLLDGHGAEDPGVSF